MRCVCDSWGSQVDDCLTEVPDADESSGTLSYSYVLALATAAALTASI